MTDWNPQEAQQLCDNGMTWADIGLHFGITGSTAHARLDPVYARIRQDKVNARRRMGRVVPAIVPEIEGGIFETASGILAYRKFMPNLVKLGEAMSAKGEGTNISLPWVSILAASGVTA